MEDSNDGRLHEVIQIPAEKEKKKESESTRLERERERGGDGEIVMCISR